MRNDIGQKLVFLYLFFSFDLRKDQHFFCWSFFCTLRKNFNMLYLGIKDVFGRIKESNLDVITEGDDDLLDSEELDAVSEVQSYLSHDYDVAKIFQPLETPDFVFHPTIKRMVIDIMLYNLHNSRVNPRNIPENIVNKRDDAIKWLRDVANPKTNTNAPFLPKKIFEERRNNHMSWGSQAKNSHKY